MSVKKDWGLLMQAGLLLGLLVSAAAAPAPAPVRSHAPAAVTNAATTVEIPKSVFVIPINSKEGRDPFFPNSVRVYSTATSAKTNVVTTAANLVLKLGVLSPNFATIISGTSSRTLAAGEETEFNIPGGPYHIKCLEIKAESVIIEINGERRELRLRESMR